MNKPWIFFDCFNTLIDDFDTDGDETGMKPLGKVAVDHGWCESPDEFHTAYLQWRANTWTGTSWHEVDLHSRLQEVLSTRITHTHVSLDELVEKLLEEFNHSFPPTVRLAPGVTQMLDRWHGKINMGVVSNFFIPGMPKIMLEKLGLEQYFSFVLDSAQVGSKKPGREIYFKALRKAGLDQPSRSILFIGDNLVNDYEKPRSLGFSSVFFDRSGDRPSPPAGQDVVHIRHWDEFDPGRYMDR